MHKSLVI